MQFSDYSQILENQSVQLHVWLDHVRQALVSESKQKREETQKSLQEILERARELYSAYNKAPVKEKADEAPKDSAASSEPKADALLAPAAAEEDRPRKRNRDKRLFTLAGLLYAHGLHLPDQGVQHPDLVSANQYFEQANEMEDINAAFFLSYLQPEPTAPNEVDKVVWFMSSRSKAAIHPLAAAELAKVQLKNAIRIQQNPKKALQFAKFIAEAEANVNMAIRYGYQAAIEISLQIEMVKRPTESPLKISREFFGMKKVESLKSDSRALMCYGAYLELEEADGKSRDALPSAESIYRQAAEQGHRDGYLALARLYEKQDARDEQGFNLKLGEIYLCYANAYHLTTYTLDNMAHDELAAKTTAQFAADLRLLGQEVSANKSSHPEVDAICNALLVELMKGKRLPRILENFAITVKEKLRDAVDNQFNNVHLKPEAKLQLLKAMVNIGQPDPHPLALILNCPRSGAFDLDKDTVVELTNHTFECFKRIADKRVGLNEAGWMNILRECKLVDGVTVRVQKSVVQRGADLVYGAFGAIGGFTLWKAAPAPAQLPPADKPETPAVGAAPVDATTSPVVPASPSAVSRP